MDTSNIEVRLEDFICRIPALFPYLKWNEDGSVDTCVATDSPNGCYGKIVDNMHIPAGVRLTNYVIIQSEEIPNAYSWNNENTILLAEDEKTYFANSGFLYLRKVNWYYYESVNSETLPVAVELESLPSFVGDDSPSRVKIPQKGMDGIPVECSGVVLYDYYLKKARYTFYKREDIISPCKTYSYRTLIYEYYKYKDIVGEGNSFIKFVNTGIGLMKVDRKLLNLTDEEKYCELPEEVYLSQVRTLLSKYREYQTASMYYTNHYIANGRTDSILLAKSEKYVRMGGDNMTNWLAQISQKAYDVANEYKCHTDNKDFPLALGLDLMLTKHSDVLGLESVDVNEFMAGNRYYDGDLLTYDGRTYICLLDRVDLENPDNNYEYIIKTKLVNNELKKGLFLLNNNAYDYVTEENIDYIPDNGNIPVAFTREYLVYKDLYYKWDINHYTPINVTSYSTGTWDEESGHYVFDSLHFVLLSELEGYNPWYDDTNIEGEDYRFFENIGYLPSTYVYDYIMANNSIFKWDDVSSAYIPVEGNSYIIKQTTNSKLRDLRALREYVNEFGNSEEPDLSEDWLYYYKVNSITGLVVETDEIGNILKDTDDFEPICHDLHAYGNVINSITYNAENNTVTFDYIIGAHLLAEYIDPPGVDVDGNTLYFYDNFTYDADSEDGIHFTETYYCIGDSIANLGEDFENYVNGDLATMQNYAFEKFPFQTNSISTPDDIQEIKGSSVISVPAENDLLHAKTIREEWMIGLYHQPKVKNNISIDRGNGASFERHVRLGEINSMEDLQNYQNGGFYQISES